MAEQLPLAFPHRPLFIDGDFLPNEANRLALEFLARPAAWPQGRLLLWGARGAGKTHLLHIWARAHSAALLQAAALDEGEWPARELALDDVDQAPSELAVLHLLNAAAEAGQKLLLTASRPPARWPIVLPDLASRLRGTASVEIGMADEAFLARLLTRLLADRQLTVKAPVQSWLLRRLPRTPGAVQDAVARLDKAALAARRGVTRKLAEAVLDEMSHDSTVNEAP